MTSFWSICKIQFALTLKGLETGLNWRDLTFTTYHVQHLDDFLGPYWYHNISWTYSDVCLSSQPPICPSTKILAHLLRSTPYTLNKGNLYDQPMSRTWWCVTSEKMPSKTQQLPYGPLELLTLGGASCHLMRTLTQPRREAHMGKNWGLQSITNSSVMWVSQCENSLSHFTGLQPSVMSSLQIHKRITVSNAQLSHS